MVGASIEVPERIGDATVVLRPLRAADIAPYAAAFEDDPALGRAIGLGRDPSEQEIRARIDEQPRRAAAGSAVELALAGPASDAFWGTLNLHSLHREHGRCEIGLWLVAAERGRGVASAAVSIALSWIFGPLGLARVESCTAVDNDQALALAGRLRFAREGTLRSRDVVRGQRVDVACFGLLCEEWPPR